MMFVIEYMKDYLFKDHNDILIDYIANGATYNEIIK